MVYSEQAWRADDPSGSPPAGATWAADSATLYYTTVDDAWRTDTVWRHRLGSGLPSEKVYHEPDEQIYYSNRRPERSAQTWHTGEITFCTPGITNLKLFRA